MNEATAPERPAIRVALCGNSNSGKTCIFNELTNRREHVGNWPGVTVEKAIGTTSLGEYTIEVTDLPGTYSLTAFTVEEIIVRDFIIKEKPDVVVNVIDAGNLERSLYLTTQLIELGVKGVVALNMIDEAGRHGLVFDRDKMAELLGMPVVPTIGCRGEGLEDLKENIVRVHKGEAATRHIHIDYGREAEEEIKKIQQSIRKDSSLKGLYSTRWLSVKLLEHDQVVTDEIRKISSHADGIDHQVRESDRHIEAIGADESEALMADGRYGFINGIVREACEFRKPDRVHLSDQIDRIVTNRVLSYPIFFLLLWIMFYSTFALGSYPVQWLTWVVDRFSHAVSLLVPDGWVEDLIVNGVIAGVGSVAVYVPSIMILFFFISLFEDSGYMARAAFTMDRLMHYVGLHGKSFIPLVMGFGCNAPAIMATRMLQSKSDRFITILINPLISCSARLPVYVLIAGACFGAQAGNVIFSIYLLSIILAVLMGRIFRRVFFKGEAAPFVLELPPYRVPLLKSVMIHMWENGSIFLRKVGGIIFGASIIIWILSSYPVDETMLGHHERQRAQMEAAYAERLNALSSMSAAEGMNSQRLEAEREHGVIVARLAREQKRERVEHSFLGRIGHGLEPLISPLGFSWREGVALITGFTSKEIMISTLSILYQAGEGPRGSLKEILAREMTPLVAYSFLIFTLIYIPCLGTLVMIQKELGSWKWAAFTVFYTLALAWILSFLVYQTGRLMGFA